MYIRQHTVTKSRVHLQILFSKCKYLCYYCMSSVTISPEASSPTVLTTIRVYTTLMSQCDYWNSHCSIMLTYYIYIV